MRVSNNTGIFDVGDANIAWTNLVTTGPTALKTPAATRIPRRAVHATTVRITGYPYHTLTFLLSDNQTLPPTAGPGDSGGISKVK